MKQVWAPMYSHQHLEVTEEKEIYSGRFRVLQNTLKFKMFSGRWSDTVTRFIMERKHAASILLYNPQRDTVIMVEQMRVGAINSSLNSPWVLEPVAGLIDSEDTPEETAVRESMEEANCKVLDLVPMHSYLVSSGISNEFCYAYCGRISHCEPGSIHGLIEESEDIKIHEITTQDAFDMLREGKIVSGGAIISLQWLQLNLVALKKMWLLK